jgi:hypothetical protein
MRNAKTIEQAAARARAQARVLDDAARAAEDQ